MESLFLQNGVVLVLSIFDVVWILPSDVIRFNAKFEQQHKLKHSRNWTRFASNGMAWFPRLGGNGLNKAGIPSQVLHQPIQTKFLKHCCCKSIIISGFFVFMSLTKFSIVYNSRNKITNNLQNKLGWKDHNNVKDWQVLLHLPQTSIPFPLD